MTPDEALLVLEQGLGHHHSGRLDEAEKLYRQILDADPAHADALHLLGTLNAGQGKVGDAISCFEQLIVLNPDDAAVHNNLGILYLDQGKSDAALASYGRALELSPDAEDVISNMAILRKEAGDRGAAETLYRRLLQINPEDAETYYNLSGVKTFTSDDPDFKAIEKFRAGSNLSPEKIMHLDFALGKAYADIGEHDRAFESIANANRLKRETLNFNIAHEEGRVERMLDVFDGDFFEARKGQGLKDAQPIFIIGMPRSGTTLAEQILASHTDVLGAGEREFLANTIGEFSAGKNWMDAVSSFSGDDFRRLGEAYMAKLTPLASPRSAGVPRITDKMPRNFFFAGIIALSLPGAKIVHCRRDAMDTCLSNFEHLFPGGQEFTYDQGELGRYYVLYARLMDHWRAVLGGRIFDLDYEALIAEPEPVMRELLEFCGLGWQDACLDFHKTKRSVRTASSAQVRQPLYTSAIKRWKKYEKHLAPLLDALGPLADRD